jgi:hypothetical protein
MGALSLHTTSTNSLLARVARLPAEILELIYKQFVHGPFKRVAAKRIMEKNMIYKGENKRSRAFGAPPIARLGNVGASGAHTG